MPYCKECGYEYVAGVKTCPDCGVPLLEEAPVSCPSCEEPVLGEAVFCPHCGVFLGWASSAAEEITCARHAEAEPSGACVICGTPVCDQCAVIKQGKIFCGNDEHLKMAFDWVSVHTASTPYEAEMVKANLEGAGIAATVLSQSDRMYFVTVGNLAVAEVMVPKATLEAAQQVLREMKTTGAGDGHTPGPDRRSP